MPTPTVPAYLHRAEPCAPKLEKSVDEIVAGGDVGDSELPSNLGGVRPEIS